MPLAVEINVELGIIRKLAAKELNHNETTSNLTIFTNLIETDMFKFNCNNARYLWHIFCTQTAENENG